jgi:hypothetical protein
LTLTKKGTVGGDMLGYYDSQGHWAAVSLGVYEGEPIAFSSSINDGGLYSLTSGSDWLHEGRWENSSTHDQQEYEYIEGGLGWGYKKYEDSTVSGAEYFLDHTYLKWQGQEEGKPPHITDEGDWPEGFDVSSLGESPDPNDSNWTLVEGDTVSNANILDDAGSFDAIMGGYMPADGPQDLWSTSQGHPASLILMGTLDINSSYINDYLLFGSEVRSYNPYDFTHTTPDGGAYWGWIGGIIDDVRGNIRALYIDPQGNAGILKGTFTGNDYRSIRMWEADGTIYAEKMATVQYNPSQLMDISKRVILSGISMAILIMM